VRKSALLYIAAAGGLAYWAYKRLTSTTVRGDWSLYREPSPVGPKEVVFATLLDRLRDYGYDPTLMRELGLATLREAGRDGHIVLDLRELERQGWATVEVHDAGDKLCDELARYVIYELGAQLPGLTYRGTYADPSIEPASTDELKAALPERPTYL
jgi:hypothetical protein